RRPPRSRRRASRPAPPRGPAPTTRRVRGAPLSTTNPLVDSPAKAGVQGERRAHPLGPRFRGGIKEIRRIRGAGIRSRILRTSMVNLGAVSLYQTFLKKALQF